MKFGVIVENINFYPDSREINYSDSSITQNTRGSFPLNFLPNAKIPAVGDHPSNIIFLTCDTKGVLPPVSILSNEQALFQFLSGYTAKIGGTDLTSKSPESTFSACFGEIFLPLDPVIYAKMFYEKIRQHKVKVWLINTGYFVAYLDGLEDSTEWVSASPCSIPTLSFMPSMKDSWTMWKRAICSTLTCKFQTVYLASQKT